MVTSEAATLSGTNDTGLIWENTYMQECPQTERHKTAHF